MQQLRAQVPVLKKAVLDEQANEEQLKVMQKIDIYCILFFISILKFHVMCRYFFSQLFSISCLIFSVLIICTLLTHC